MIDFYCGSYPTTRLRRNRKNQLIRDLISETKFDSGNLILPLFVVEGKNQNIAIPTLPNIYRLSIDLIIKKIKEAKKVGINSIMLFPAIDQKLKSNNGKEAWNPNNLICRAIKEIKDNIPEITIICDVALDPYTLHGHDGIIDNNGYVINDATIEALCQQAIVQAKSGCDAIAPSDMMDGRIQAIRKALDQNNFIDTSIISYAVKYASYFYEPFRSAVGSSVNLKKADKKTYQIDFRNSDESIREIALDIQEGADMIIIKPAISYLDIIYRAKQNFQIPLIAYQVSAEYAMLKALEKNNGIDFLLSCYENLIAMKRAGANSIISYASLEIAKAISAKSF